MGTERRPLFCDQALAARIERAEADFMTQCTAAARGRAEGFAMPLAGGVATFADTDSPFNKVAGLGFAGVPADAELAEVEAAFQAHGCPVQVELAALGDPAIGELLTGRGYRLVSFENVLGRALSEAGAAAMPPGIEVRSSGDDELAQWLALDADAVAHPDTEGVPSHEEFPYEVVENSTRDMVATGIRRYSALRDGTLAGVASFRVSGTIAQLTGAATAPRHRRHGVQTALLAARLAAAAAAGCELAVVTTQPGSKSHQNVQRQGFDLLYTRAILVK
ncbi:GNAT family N-acetyltransferase [Labedaea rhizosphaerae]|uniref:Acetyltransferase (GNAT) family protein n=1 Tax=Labedaea rhizosphaerae TaxID=598644 RepID=A0A4V3CZL8_LABRH|nr:GNAT family N-acetyltransferase [Labedaea rhizosphaerae]TDQ00241.1 acetyltransferase (GNAT) family protein [Labedaea rhizosphaerae]